MSVPTQLKTAGFDLLQSGLRSLRATHDPDRLTPNERLAVLDYLHAHPATALFTRDEAGMYVGFKPTSLEVMACRRAGPPVTKCGRLSRYQKARLDAWLASRTTANAEG